MSFTLHSLHFFLREITRRWFTFVITHWTLKTWLEPRNVASTIPLNLAISELESAYNESPATEVIGKTIEKDHHCSSNRLVQRTFLGLLIKIQNRFQISYLIQGVELLLASLNTISTMLCLILIYKHLFFPLSFFLLNRPRIIITMIYEMFTFKKSFNLYIYIT